MSFCRGVSLGEVVAAVFGSVFTAVDYAVETLDQTINSKNDDHRYNSQPDSLTEQGFAGPGPLKQTLVGLPSGHGVVPVVVRGISMSVNRGSGNGASVQDNQAVS